MSFQSISSVSLWFRLPTFINRESEVLFPNNFIFIVIRSQKDAQFNDYATKRVEKKVRSIILYFSKNPNKLTFPLANLFIIVVVVVFVVVVVVVVVVVILRFQINDDDPNRKN